MSKKKKDTGATVSENENGQSVINIHDSDKFVEHLESVSEAMQPTPKFYDGVIADASVTILKASVTKDDQLKVEYTAHMSDGNSREVKLQADAIVHADLKNAFDKLIPHMVILCDQKGSDDEAQALEQGILPVPFENQIPEYSVTGFSTGKSNDGITIIGYKNVDTGKVLNLNSPFEQFSESGYQYINQLRDALKSCKNEVVAYLNGKSGFKQKDMFEDSGDDILGTETKQESATPEESADKTW